MDMLTRWTSICLLVAMPSVALSQMDKECIKGDTECLNKKLSEMQNKLIKLEDQLKHASPAAANKDTLKERVVKLEQNQKKSDKKISRSVTGLNNKFEKLQDRVRFNGFLTAGVIKGTDDVAWGALEQTDLGDDFSFKTESVLGLQSSYKLSDAAEATIQLVSRGVKDFSVEADWVYVKYKLLDSLDLRVGRMRLPFYLFSETMEVGFAYPWVTPPYEFYRTDFPNYEGMDLLYKFNTGNVSHLLQVLYGGFKDEFVDTGALGGLNYTGSLGSWSLKATYIEGVAVIVPLEALEASGAIPSASGLVMFEDIGLQYDDGQWMAIAEWTAFDANEGPIPTYESFYLTLGRQYNKWMPNISLIRYYTTEKNNDPSAPLAITGLPGNITPFEGNSAVILGVRYSLSSTVALKVEAYRAFDFTEAPDGTISNGIYTFGQSAAEDAGHLGFITIVLDAVF